MGSGQQPWTPTPRSASWRESGAGRQSSPEHEQPPGRDAVAGREQRAGTGPARGPRLEPLLPRPFRPAAAIVVAACAAVTAVLGVHYAGGTQAGRLDSFVDPRVADALNRFPSIQPRLEDLGTLGPVTLMTLALILACLATRRWSGAILAVIAEPAAVCLTEYVLKPAIGRVDEGWLSFPSGHATSMFGLAAICAVLLTGPDRRLPRALRWLLILAAFAVAAAVAAAMVAIGAHYFTDVIGGAAVGIGVVLACALALDLVMSQGPRG
jgi:membrane-associated phospholipid phosphatase